jgi:hypothetical protein
MKIFRQIIETDAMEFFVADAIHDDGKIQSIKVFPIKDEVVQNSLHYGMNDLTALVEKMQEHLTESMKE